MGLSTALTNALSSLNVNQQALSILSQNIANANTPGYSRQIVNVQADYLSGQGTGVSIQDVTRKIDQYLQQSIVSQTSTTGQTGVASDYGSRIQLLLGTPGSGNDVGSTITNFFDDLQTLSNDPGDPTQQESVIQAGSGLASQFNSLSTGLQGLRFQADQDIGTSINAVNNDLKNLFEVNGAIATATGLGQNIAGLQDTQDSLVSDLSQYLNVQTITQSNNVMYVYTSNGTSLVDNAMHQLSYSGATSTETFTNNTPLSAINVSTVDGTGTPVGTPTALTTAGVSSSIGTILTSGKLFALLQMRDKQLPGMLTQLDQLASTVRDQVNAVNNSGSSYPGANSLTGTSLVSANQFSQWGGSVRIAALDQNGNPIPSAYDDQAALPPLTLNLSTLNTGNGAGNPSVQGIINAINQYYTPANKVELGNLNNIQLVSDNASTPSSPAQLKMDLDLQNLSTTSSNVFVTGVQVADDQGNAVSNGVLATTPLSISGFQTDLTNPTQVTVNVASTAGLSNGQQIYISDPGGDVNGIPEADMTGVFTISNVSSNSFMITTADPATSASTVAPTNPTSALSAYATSAANSDVRTSTNGFITADLSSHPASSYYTVTVNALVTDPASGAVSKSAISYRVFNNDANTLNKTYAAQSADGAGKVVAPKSVTPAVQAILVDANGNELPKINGQYTTLQQGYLEIKATNSSNVVAIDSMDSQEQGQPNNLPPIPGTGRGFSYYFDLNDFFQQPQLGTAQVANSAQDLQVQQRMIDDPGLISTGNLAQSNTIPYAYQRNIGDNTVANKLSGLSSQLATFAGAGGIGQVTETFADYAAQIVGAASTTAATAATNDTNATTLLTGYQQQSSAISGVNLNTELANTIIYQNAYTASARVITVTNDLFTTLLQTFQ